MATKAKATGRKGIDRWTSNGYGIKVEKTPTPKTEPKPAKKG